MLIARVAACRADSSPNAPFSHIKNLAAEYNASMCRSYTNLSSTSSIRTTVTPPFEAIHKKAQRPPLSCEPTQAARVAIISTDSSVFHSTPTSAVQDPDKGVATNHTSSAGALAVTPCDSITPPTPTVHVHWTSADDSIASSACSLTAGVSRRLVIPCYCVTPRPYDAISHCQASPPPPPRPRYSVIQIGEIPDRLFLPLL